jgi:hypothetical protein
MRSRTFTFLGLTLALAVLASEAHGQTDCPQSYLQVYRGTKHYSNAAQRSISASDYVYSDAGAQYDLIAGTLGAEASATIEHGATAEVGVMARCTVNGIAIGTPLSFTASLHVTGDAGNGPYGSGWGTVLIREDGTSNEQSAGTYVGVLSTDIGIGLQKNAGDAFVLYLQAHAEALGDGSGIINGSLSFSGLPPGASVAICLGSDPGGPVPAKRHTWGALKTMYR